MLSSIQVSFNEMSFSLLFTLDIYDWCVFELDPFHRCRKFQKQTPGRFFIGEIFESKYFSEQYLPFIDYSETTKIEIIISKQSLKSEIVQFRIMGDCEVADTEAAVGLGCALESFAEVDEVKS
jgi:hypothetical protein